MILIYLKNLKNQKNQSKKLKVLILNYAVILNGRQKFLMLLKVE